MENTQGKRSKKFLIWLAVIVLIGGGIYGMVKLAGRNPVATPGTLYAAIGAGDWITGSETSKIELVEYSDYQCPACATFYQQIKSILADNPDQIKFVYRNFPLSFHANASIAAYAAEAAGLQGKFWEMHDLIFTNQSVWSDQTNESAKNIFAGYASQLGLNIDQFNSDIDSQEIKNKVENDYQTGLKSGVEGTPTFYLNGKQMVITSFDGFRNTITDAINNQ